VASFLPKRLNSFAAFLTPRRRKPNFATSPGEALGPGPEADYAARARIVVVTSTPIWPSNPDIEGPFKLDPRFRLFAVAERPDHDPPDFELLIAMDPRAWFNPTLLSLYQALAPAIAEIEKRTPLNWARRARRRHGLALAVSVIGLRAFGRGFLSLSSFARVG
jgi:hypothetical protein